MTDLRERLTLIVRTAMCLGSANLSDKEFAAEAERLTSLILGLEPIATAVARAKAADEFNERHA